MLSFHIVAYGKFDYTFNAITSILRFAPPPFEILLLENSPDIGDVKHFVSRYGQLATNPACAQTLRYHWRPDNLGFSAGHNYLASIADPAANFFILLNSDMFFAPTTIKMLSDTARSKPEIGIVCASQVMPHRCEGVVRERPTTKDVDRFAEFFSATTAGEFLYGRSALPFCVSRSVWRKLSTFDVWADAEPLCQNKFCGAFDEGLDPTGLGWHADWDLFNRVQLLDSYKIAMLEHAYAYHYHHVSVDDFEKRNPEFTKPSEVNYTMKYGPPTLPLDLSKYQKKCKPADYPTPDFTRS